MPDLPLVCIMIPTYNQAKYIRKAVESALAQDYPNLEIVIADDYSTDNTEQVLQPFIQSAIIQYRKNTSNLGRVGNYRNCLNNYTTADWVINLDGDDYYTNNRFISQAMSAIRANGINNTLFYQGANVRKFGPVEKTTGPNMEAREEAIKAKDYFFNFFERNYFAHMSTLYHRRLAIEENFYHLDIISADIYSFLRLCLKYGEKKVIVSKNIAGVWLQHECNTSASLNIRKHWMNAGLYKKLYEQAIEKGYHRITCIKWLARAGYTYLAGYILKSVEVLKSNREQSL